MPRLYSIWLAVFLSPLWVTTSGFSSDATAPDTEIQPGVESQSRVESLRSVRGKLERRQNGLSGKTSYALRDLQTGIRYRIYANDSTRLQPFVGRTVRMRGHGWNRSDIDVGYLRIGAAAEPTVPSPEPDPAERRIANHDHHHDHDHNHNEPVNHTEPALLSDSGPQTLPAGWVSRNGQTPVAIETPVSELSDGVATFGTLEIPTPVGTRLHDLDLLDNPSHRCPQCGALPDYACGPAGAAWVRAEYLYWRSAGMSLPPLVTTSPIATPAEQAGILGETGTQTLIGAEDVLDDRRGGGRVRVGLWLGPARVWGIEGDYLALDDLNYEMAQDSSLNGVDVLAQPFFNIHPLDAQENPEIPGEDAYLLAYPQLSDGAVQVRAGTSMRSASLHLLRFLGCRDFPQESVCGPGCAYYSRVNLLLGFQFMEFEEYLSVLSQTQPIGSIERWAVSDQFDTTNDFQGGEIGFHWQAQRHVWTFDLLGRVAVGNVHQLVNISGQTVHTDTSGTETLLAGGLLAQRTNSGIHERNVLGLIPQAQATVGVFLTPQLRFTLGYSLIYWTNVVRPTDAIDRDLNPQLLPPESVPFSGPERPGFAFQQQDFWAQGFHAGLDYRW